MVPERDRLRALQMRVAGHERLGLGFGAVDEDEREPTNRGQRLVACILDVQAERRRDLVVARSAGVDLAADGPESLLDGRVHVLRIG